MTYSYSRDPGFYEFEFALHNNHRRIAIPFRTESFGTYVRPPMFTRVTRLFVTHHKQIPFPLIVCIPCLFTFISLFILLVPLLLFFLFIYAFSTFQKEFYNDFIFIYSAR